METPKVRATKQLAYMESKLSFFRLPSLKFFRGEKKTVHELARLCGLTFKDGKVG